MGDEQKHQVAMLAAAAAKERCGGDYNGIGGMGRTNAFLPAQAAKAVTDAYLAALESLTPKSTPAKRKPR